MKWNQINGIDGIDKTVRIGNTNESGIECSTDLNGWTEGMEIMEQMVSIKSIEVMEPMELNV